MTAIKSATLQLVVVPSSATVQPPISKMSFKKPVKIDFEDIIDEVHYWKSVVVCFVLDSNPLLHVMEGYVRGIWKAVSLD